MRYLVNVGPGRRVDEAALIRALRAGWIAGAGLDVFEHEPLPPDSPLWDMANVIITGHYAGVTPHTMTGRSRSSWTTCAATAPGSRCAM